jgi:hypothetical protein
MLLRSIYFIFFTIILSACTTTREFYTFDDNDEFGITNSILMVGGVALLGVGVNAFKDPAFTKGFVKGYNVTNGLTDNKSCNGIYCNEEQAWDYLSGNSQWRCRDTGGTNGGQFVANWQCSGQAKYDNWK